MTQWREKPISLRNKILWILFMVIALFVTLDYLILGWVISPSFESFGKREAYKDLGRCEAGIDVEREHMDARCLSLSRCNEIWIYTYQKGRGSEERPVLNTDGLDAVYICDIDGNVIWNQLLGTEPSDAEPPAGYPLDALTDNYQLALHDSDDGLLSGIIMIDDTPIMVSSRPILQCSGMGPSAGTLVIGKFLDEELLATIAERMKVEFHLIPAAPGLDTNPINVSTISMDEDKLISKVVNDINGEPAFVLKGAIPRGILIRSKNVIAFSQVSVLAAALLVLTVLLTLIQRTVVQPITELTGHVVETGKTQDFSNRIDMKRDDEIGTLAYEFDDMMFQLDTARKKLMDQSFSAGKGEMISLVLHNVRNILTPIVCEIDVMREKISKAPIDQMIKVEYELSQGDATPEREKDLKEFIALGIENLSNLANELTGKMCEVLNRTNEVVALLGDYGKEGNAEKPAEKVKLDDLIKESIALMPKDMYDSVSVEINPEIDELEPLVVHRTTCREVITELLMNAAEAINRANVEGGRIDIHADREDAEGVPVVHVRICDNGEGIEPDTLDQIFNRGFTSKEDGHTGAGLHWCANTIANMNGSLKAESKGDGQGACMHIILPQTPASSDPEEEN